ncbi:unnamed protein product [Didymodactylos carnosus]|uniref:FAD-binding PCMH-type domain-containing protein n=1 Tax=Didymodactylos carnosus TaxID=1234261 RepID=A0A813U117_9BILA|nr:unnamed protein product [Didymodactylos carnosus]CAF0945667.1 unnamed protein product [Didymodactylos carnosus]CAF3606527.1 unnamed protein product [Didymodactylos carnosus]CAF3720358.1 unnamed protein product [Didymodactylos carnosus]
MSTTGVSNYFFENWAKTYSCIPKLYFEPQTIVDLQSIVCEAHKRKEKIRVVGCGHSPSAICTTDGYMISMKHLNKIREVNKDEMYVEVESGVTIQQLNDELPKWDLCLPNQGSISELTLTGLVSTASHGTGINYGTMSSYIRSITLMLLDGTIKEYSPTDEFLYWLATYIPRLIPYINQFYLWHESTHSLIIEDRCDKIFNFDCLFRQYVNEWAIPLKETAYVLHKLQSWLDENQHVIRVHFPIEIRFVKRDTHVMLSPTSGELEGNFCYINIIMYRPYEKDIEYEPWWHAFEAICLEVNGRPHWAKAHSLTSKTLRKLYPNAWDKFHEIRRQFDPHDQLVNDYLHRMFEE